MQKIDRKAHQPRSPFSRSRRIWAEVRLTSALGSYGACEYAYDSIVLSDLTFGADYDQVSRYDSASGEWQHFVNDAEFNDFNTVEYGKGYEIYVANPNGITFTVEGRLSLTP